MRPDFDVIIIGAGLSGIDAGYHLQRTCPDKSYTILEARTAMGGTWDLFRYPGIRSDSDLFTFGFPFKPWRDEMSLADGPAIKAYIEDTAAQFGIDRHIQFGSSVTRAGFDTDTATWTLTLSDHRTITCNFLYSCAGYYDYEQGIPAGLAGHGGLPRAPSCTRSSGPRTSTTAGKRVVVIGSGATAVTLIPAMAPTAEHITMVQRSPTWISPLPRTDPLADAARKHLPPQVAHRLIRAKNIALQHCVLPLQPALPHRCREVAPPASGQGTRRRGIGGRALHPGLRRMGPAGLRGTRRGPVPGDPLGPGRRRHRRDRPDRRRGRPPALRAASWPPTSS